MKDRLATLLLGAWLLGSLMMFVVAPTNFHMVDELLAHSHNQSFRSLVESMGSSSARELLRYLSSELNRELFERWNVVQALLGLELSLLVTKRAPGKGIRLAAVFDERWRRVRLPLMLATAIVLVFVAWAIPAITSLGRSLDFVPREPPPPELASFKRWHVVYTVLDVLKVGCVAVAAFWLTRGTPESSVASVPAAAPEAAGAK
jgi:hypothetical protein